MLGGLRTVPGHFCAVDLMYWISSIFKFQELDRHRLSMNVERPNLLSWQEELGKTDRGCLPPAEVGKMSRDRFKESAGKDIGYRAAHGVLVCTMPDPSSVCPRGKTSTKKSNGLR